MADGPYRLLTRADFDGIVSARLLCDAGVVDRVEFAHPRDVEAGRTPVDGGAVLATLPTRPEAVLCFHHRHDPCIVGTVEPRAMASLSTARVIYDHYGTDAFTEISRELIDAVDRCTAGHLDEADIQDPAGWVMLNFVMDARTGLGRFTDFAVSNTQLMLDMVGHLREPDPDRVLAQPDVHERVALYRDHARAFADQLKRCTAIHGRIGIIDLRYEDFIFCGNRFLVYALVPEIDISLDVYWGRERKNTVIAAGRSVLGRRTEVDLGRHMVALGGGGHPGAGSCQVDNDAAARILDGLVSRIAAEL